MTGVDEYTDNDEKLIARFHPELSIVHNYWDRQPGVSYDNREDFMVMD